MRSHHDILVDAERAMTGTDHSFYTTLMAEVGEERPTSKGFEELELVMLERVSDAFAELYPDHVGIGLTDAVFSGIPALGLTGRQVSAAVARRAVENCPA
ncbi:MULTISPECIES: hypothetical protein [Methylobacterium]|jgi:hypothetical protein|uniref:Uncharacterized protein n=1 Tax=Methylobacterium jeotgali TaxID=381630 RepID=A0ABQ4SYV5_9HYPH|nr:MULTISPECIES: hypothetical protein [Methylobacterium]PIU05250.1 MAG: hypothetical protein COT56_15795 [Methylobacterium sp. CG09_land_8_20_14_0_10_71_15]PIU11993.1 MAG: hypothetical protein COT28_17130 [Methylobacterium sp. CG08_land_8_20_14_0_20_71_15]GBU16810.1 hypothetical protein AwMethylo_10250 [Methylobacterium sp.]GJE08357.1 hypothetical protein AOPFMNJM_3694 [Methylobacterium jeotgali]